MPDNAQDKTFGVVDAVACRKLIETLEDGGSRVFRFPEMEFEPTSEAENVKTTIQNLKSFDWIIFTDVHSVDVFLETFDENNVDPFHLDDLIVCAFGEAVADRLRFRQVHADVIPPDQKTSSIFDTIKNYLGDTSQLGSLKALFVKESNREFEIAELLVNCAEEIAAVEIYEFVRLRESEKVRLGTLLKGGAIDEFVFCSPDDVVNFLYIFDGVLISDLLKGIEVAAVDGITFQTLRELGLKPKLTPLI